MARRKKKEIEEDELLEDEELDDEVDEEDDLDDDEEDEEDLDDEEEDDLDDEDDAPSSRRSRRSAGASRGVRAPRTGAPKSQAVAFLLSAFLGFVGADRFYLGHVGIGVAKLLGTVVTGVLLFVPSTTLGIQEPIANAILVVLGSSLVIALQIHDFILIGMGRMTDKYGTPLDGVAGNDPHPERLYHGRAFLLQLFAGYAGQCRFYLKSKPIGYIQVALLVIGTILLIVSDPHWQGFRQENVISKIEAEFEPAPREAYAAALKEGAEDLDGIKPVIRLTKHTLTVLAYPSEKDRKEYEEANKAYNQLAISALPMSAKTIYRAAPLKPAAEPAEEGAEEEAPVIEEEAPSRISTKLIPPGTRTETVVFFDGRDLPRIRRSNIALVQERITEGMVEHKPKGMALLALTTQIPFKSDRGTLFLAGVGVLGLLCLWWFFETLLAGMGKLKDSKGKPLSLDTTYSLVHCQACDEQMTVDLSQPKLEGLVCKYDECGNQARIDDKELLDNVRDHRNSTLSHSLLGVGFFIAAALSLLSAFSLLQPNSAGDLSNDENIIVAVQVLFGGAVILLGLTIWQAVMAEKPKTVCELE